jgi:hypothetical protein
MLELRPPRTDLDAEAGMGAWIDLNQALRRLARDELFIFVTDNAVGAAEEENLAHLGANIAGEVDIRRIVPILTTKHTLEYCLLFASRATAQGYDALTVLGGDSSVGAPRCVPHASDLRKLIRPRAPGLALGGWLNPFKDADTQVGYLAAPDAHADFALAQVVSHHAIREVERLLEAKERSGLPTPVVWGVFYYRSANPKTLRMLSGFLPVPAEEITREFADGADADEICARTIRVLRAVGADKIYVSNLGSRGAGKKLAKILEQV